MEKDQLISMIHFLVKREEERAQENQELKNMVKELRGTHKQDVKTQANLMLSIDNLTRQVADLTTQNRMISERMAEIDSPETRLRTMNIKKTHQQDIGNHAGKSRQTKQEQSQTCFDHALQEGGRENFNQL